MAQPKKRMPVNVISASMEGTTRGNLYFGFDTTVALKLYQKKSVDVSHSRTDPSIILFQFRDDDLGGYRLYERYKEKSGVYLRLKRSLARAGAKTGWYRIKNDKGIITADFKRGATNYEKERKRVISR